MGKHAGRERPAWLVLTKDGGVRGAPQCCLAKALILPAMVVSPQTTVISVCETQTEAIGLNS
jgi:hypothetical protein